MLKVVLDTNCILSSVSHRSAFRIIIDKLYEAKYELLVSNEILNEYEEKLSEIFSSEVAEDFIGALLILPNVIFCNIYYKFQLVPSDEEDEKFVDCALAGNAHFLVSNDKALLKLKSFSFPYINVISKEQFTKILSVNK